MPPDIKYASGLLLAGVIVSAARYVRVASAVAYDAAVIGDPHCC
jgi:hypothetical protein